MNAKRPADALAELVSIWWPRQSAADLHKIEWKEIQARSAALDDPLTSYALGLAIEEFALVDLPSDNNARPLRLLTALACFDRASTILRGTAVWRERWPVLANLAQAGHDRLVSDAAAISRAQSLRTELRLTEARVILEQALQRHPGSFSVRQEFVRTLVDEAQTSADKRQELLGRALEQLENARTADANLPTSALMQLAELRERLGRQPAAEDAYREVSERSLDKSERLKARSRLIVLQIRHTD